MTDTNGQGSVPDSDKATGHLDRAGHPVECGSGLRIQEAYQSCELGNHGCVVGSPAFDLASLWGNRPLSVDLSCRQVHHLLEG